MDSFLFSPLSTGLALVLAVGFGIAWWRQRARTRDAERRLAEPTESDRPDAGDRRSRELRALGRLSGNIAHDFNNVLTVVSANTEILLMELGMPGADLDAERLESSLEQVQTAARRGALLARRLLTFGRTSAPLPRDTLDAGETVQRIGEALAASLPAGVELRVDCEAAAGHVQAQEDQLDEILGHLVRNAADALGSSGAVTLSLRSPPGSGEIELAVVDEGEGMSADVQARLFEPFFTTKPAGADTGFGLSTVHGIVQRLGGRIEVHSRLQEGSTFRVRLPRVEAQPAGPED